MSDSLFEGIKVEREFCHSRDRLANRPEWIAIALRNGWNSESGRAATLGKIASCSYQAACSQDIALSFRRSHVQEERERCFNATMLLLTRDGQTSRHARREPDSLQRNKRETRLVK
jgi:hypothetical protein